MAYLGYIVIKNERGTNYKNKKQCIRGDIV